MVPGFLWESAEDQSLKATETTLPKILGFRRRHDSTGYCCSDQRTSEIDLTTLETHQSLIILWRVLRHVRILMLQSSSVNPPP